MREGKEAVLVGLGMAPRGEVALIIALVGLTAGVLTSAEYSIIASVALLTTLVTPLLLSRLLSQKTTAADGSTQ